MELSPPQIIVYQPDFQRIDERNRRIAKVLTVNMYTCAALFFCTVVSYLLVDQAVPKGEIIARVITPIATGSFICLIGLFISIIYTVR